MERRKVLLEIDPKFKAEFEARRAENKKRADEMRAEYGKMKADADAKRSEERSKADNIRLAVEGSVANFVAQTKFKTVDPDVLERKLDEGLWCPICRQKDTSHNIVNGEPTCMRTSENGKQCWHRLVPKDELKNFNRAYRRRWGSRRS